MTIVDHGVNAEKATIRMVWNQLQLEGCAEPATFANILDHNGSYTLVEYKQELIIHAEISLNGNIIRLSWDRESKWQPSRSFSLFRRNEPMYIPQGKSYYYHV
jgi:hypothetical protein